MASSEKKTVKKGKVQLDMTYSSGQIHYQVSNGEQRAKSSDLCEALGSAKVKEKKANFFIQQVKSILGF